MPLTRDLQNGNGIASLEGVEWPEDLTHLALVSRRVYFGESHHTVTADHQRNNKILSLEHAKFPDYLTHLDLARFCTRCLAFRCVGVLCFVTRDMHSLQTRRDKVSNSASERQLNIQF